MEDREDEIIIEQEEVKVKQNNTQNNGSFWTKLFTNYLTIALCIGGIFFNLLARFVLLCNSYVAYQWIGFIGFVLIVASVVIELIKIVKNGKVEWKSSLLPVLAIALIFI